MRELAYAGYNGHDPKNMPSSWGIKINIKK